MSRQSLDAVTAGRVRWLAVATAACALFAAISYPQLRLVTVSPTIAVALVVAGILGVVAAQARRNSLVLAVGTALVLLGMYRLATYGHGSAGIGGASSTAALLTGLGVCFLGLGYLGATAARR